VYLDTGLELRYRSIVPAVYPLGSPLHDPRPCWKLAAADQRTWGGHVPEPLPVAASCWHLILHRVSSVLPRMRPITRLPLLLRQIRVLLVLHIATTSHALQPLLCRLQSSFHDMADLADHV